jgi:hypothetical protein
LERGAGATPARHGKSTVAHAAADGFRATGFIRLSFGFVQKSGKYAKPMT